MGNFLGNVLAKFQALGNRYGWGAIIAASPYLNWLAVLTTGLGVFLLAVLCSMFGIDPAPPAQSGNPVSWLLYALIMACWGWAIWAYFVAFFLIPLGAAWSLADLILARKTGNLDRFVGAVAGLSLTLLPIISYFWYGGEQTRQLIESALNHPYWAPKMSCGG
jgi:hypothetical protein